LATGPISWEHLKARRRDTVSDVKIPESLRPLWGPLHNEAVKAHAYWRAYVDLFESGQARVEHLNQQAPVFFGLILRDTLIESVQLILGRLGDPARTGGRKNGTLEKLLNEVRRLHPLESEVLKDAKASLDQFSESCRKIRIRRNKQIAHNDYRTLISQFKHGTGFAAEPPIEHATREEVEKALGCLASFMNGMEGFLTREIVNDQGNTKRSVTAYDLFRGDAGMVVDRIKEGIRYQQLSNSGQISRERLRMIEEYRW
jgi:hypothetical protein